MKIYLVRDDKKDVGRCAQCGQDFVNERGDGRTIYKTKWQGDLCVFCYEDAIEYAAEGLEI